MDALLRALEGHGDAVSAGPCVTLLDVSVRFGISEILETHREEAEPDDLTGHYEFGHSHFRYRPLYGVYPAEVNLFYVEIDANVGTIPREFIPTRYYTQATDGVPEAQHYPSPLVLDDNVATQVALRFNAKSSGLYLISADVVVSSGDERERLTVMPPQWTIFEMPAPFPDDG